MNKETKNIYFWSIWLIIIIIVLVVFGFPWITQRINNKLIETIKAKVKPEAVGESGRVEH